jgi:hypothetical protein
MHEIGKLLTGCANAIREHHQLSPVEHQQIELAVLEGLDTETRVAKAVNAVQTVRPPGATQPMILHLELGTETGPMTLRITQIAAQELAAELNKHPLTRGSA